MKNSLFPEEAELLWTRKSSDYRLVHESRWENDGMENQGKSLIFERNLDGLYFEFVVWDGPEGIELPSEMYEVRQVEEVSLVWRQVS